MTPHTTPPLAQQLRSLAASAPTLHRPALAAAADAVEELSKLRAERDEARDCIGFNAYRALESERDRISELHAASQAEIDRLRAERDEALEANAIFKKREAENMEREFVLEQQRDAALERVAELTAERDSATLGTLGFVASTLRAERDALLRIEAAARTLMDESQEVEVDDFLARSAELSLWHELEGALSEHDAARKKGK